MRTTTTASVSPFRVLISAALCAFAASAQAQNDGVPRMPDGRPDLSGTWDNGSGIDFVQPQQVGESICVRGCTQAAAVVPAASRPAPPPPTKPQYRPEFQARVADLAARQVDEDPVLRCMSPGVPRIGPPDKIVQRSDEVIFLYDDVSGSFFRIVPTDGRSHRADAEPSYLGDAIGRWDGDTLIVETVNFNGDSWLTDDGAFHTQDLRVVERLRRTADTLEWRVTVHDPAVLAAPWELTPRIAHKTDVDLVEAPPCIDRSLPHMVDDSHHTNPR